MAIATLDAVISGMQPPVDYVKNIGSLTNAAGRLFSPFYLAGYPVAATVPTPGLAGAALTSYSGQVPFVNGAADQYLARFSARVGVAGTSESVVYLCDRLWHNSGISVTTTTAQTVNSVAWPARDLTGTTNGVGVRIGLELSTATGAGASVHSVSYTNQAGTAGKTGSPRVAYAASSIAGAFYDYTLAAGDTGVRSVQSFTSTVSMTSGVVHLVAYRVLVRLGCLNIDTEYALDAVTAGMPKLYDDTVPFFLIYPEASTTPSQFQGQVIQTNG